MAPKKRITHGISFPNEEILRAAKEKASAMQISFSTYVNQLIRKDLGHRGVFDWEESSGTESAAHRRKTGRFKEPSLLDQREADAK